MLRGGRFRLVLYWGHVVAVRGELCFHARDVRVSVRPRSREPAESGNGERAAVSVAPTVWGSFVQFRGAMAVKVRTLFCGLRMGAYSSIRQQFVEIICVWVALWIEEVAPVLRKKEEEVAPVSC
jgi:hypothetical protein